MATFLVSRCGLRQVFSPCLLSKMSCLERTAARKLIFPDSQAQGFKQGSRWSPFSTRLVLRASSTDFGAESRNEDSRKFQVEEQWNADKNKQRRSLELAVAGAALLGVAILAAVSIITWASGGPTAFVDAVAKSGFAAAFALIFVSEIGDKTFFIAALLAMRHAKSLVLLGASAALALMTIISVAIGRIFQAVPAQLKTTLPIGEYAAVALLVFFGLKSLKNAWDIPPAPSKDTSKESLEISELSEAEEVIKKSEVNKSSTPFEIICETFSLVFLAEWGDRSMLATIALGAAQAPVGVATGAIAGHILATGLAVIGGAFLAQYISEKMVNYVGGFLFLAFAAATLLGVF
ncbi:hypothetical protein L7F22_051040 [Adiantum nelumboides]|nr:hypothetical protein [Adiantum nelumboides]